MDRLRLYCEEIVKLIKIKSKLKFLSALFVVFFFTFIFGSFFPNPYVKHQLKIEVEDGFTKWANQLGLKEPSFEYNSDVQFVQAVRKCVDWVNFEIPRTERVPIEMIVAMAALESGWGTSRFAIEGNNLFGIRTYDKNVPHVLVEGHAKWRGWAVRKFPTKCQSVEFFVKLLNNHYAYEEFRNVRFKSLLYGKQMDPKKLVKTLKAYSVTPDYADRVAFVIDSIREQEEKLTEIPINVKKDSKVNK